MTITWGLVLRPTPEEFKDRGKYMEHVEMEYGASRGMIMVKDEIKLYSETLITHDGLGIAWSGVQGMPAEFQV